MAGEPSLEYVLPAAAYEPTAEGEEYPPVVPANVTLPEFTAKAAVIGIVIGVLFGAANAYLGLKVGLTVSASIPAAVIAVAVFKALRSGTILETNLVQTIGSAGESLAAGVIFTLPVLFLWNESPGFFPIFPLAMFGGLLGVLFMVPLRRFLIVQEHGRLSYPEGTACAEVQVASQAGGSQARMLFAGMGVGGVYVALQKFLGWVPEEPDIPIDAGGYRTAVGGSITPELLGVGFIIGPRVSAVMLAGGALGWLVIIPLIYLFGAQAAGPIPPESVALIPDMGHFDIWSRYLRYIGAGAVAFGGLFTLIKSTPTLIQSFRLALRHLGPATGDARARTDDDLPMSWIGLGLAAVGLLAAFLPLVQYTVDGATERTSIGILGGLAVVVFAFFFVTVSSRIVGLIGSSSNPISGMTIATVLICSLIFGGMFGPESAKVAVLTIGALVCIAAAIAGDTSQDLKTGFLIGATPRRQQIGEIVGVVTAALAMSTVLALFREQIVSGEFKAPQANLIRLVIDGVVDGNLPWGLVFAGIAIAFCVEIMGLPTLAFAVGLYLPIHLAVPIMAGGLLRLGVERFAGKEEMHRRREVGVLYSSGMIAGAALVGVVAAAFAFFGVGLPLGTGHDHASTRATIIGLLAFAGLAATTWFMAMGRKVDSPPAG